MSDVKALLKEAREAISTKKYEEAQELCKNILRKDKQSYMGLVLLGVSLQDSEKAPLSFHRAIELDRSKPLAWQGLATYYEKHTGDDTDEKLLSIYTEMIKLDMDSGKTSEVISKLGQLGLKLKSAQTVDVLVSFLNETTDEALRQTAENQLLELLRRDICLSCSGNNIVATYEKLLETHSDDEKLSLNYAKLIAKNSKFSTFMDSIIKLKGWSTKKLLKEWLCKCIFEENVSKGSLSGFNLEKYKEELTREIDPTASSLLKCISFFESGLYKEAYQLGITLMDTKRLDDSLVTFLIRCTMRLGNWAATEKLICTVMPNMNNNKNSLKELKKALLLSYVRQENWKLGEAVGLELLNNSDLSTEDMNLLAQCLIHQNKNANDILNKLCNSTYYDSLRALQHIKKYELSEKSDTHELIEARSILDSSTSNSSDRWLYLGIVYWKLNQKDQCLIPLLKATKLDPGRSITFLYLGHYYKEQVRDLEKAKRCYFKAVSLNGASSEASRSLSGVYRELGEMEANYELMQKVSNTLDQKEYWPKMQLGLYHLFQRNWDEAIKNLRGVIRAAPGDVLAWASLADAYYSRRSFTSALKCYTKVMEMRPNETVYPETQIGTINHFLGFHAEALTSYKNVLANDPKCIIALKGISDTLKALAGEKLNQHMYNSSRENAQSAVEYAVQAITISPSFSCLWKSLGDILMLITKLPTKYAYTHVPGTLVGNDSEKSVYKMKPDIFPLVISCYSRAIKVTAFDSIPLYYDVSVAYREFYEETGDVDHCHKAFSAAEHCVKNRPKEWEYWNSLGVISISKDIKRDDFAQYCFLKALSCNQDSLEAWTNLGVLYLKHGNYRFANKAFKRAQETDPDYLCSWIGQALIAEAVKEDEAMDLFRHAAQLAYHKEAALGYSEWVCRTLQNYSIKNDPNYKYAIENMHAIPVALDLMTWFCEYQPRNPCAATLLGLLQERSGLLSSATDSFKRALEGCPSLKERNIAALNMGRILLRTCTYSEALQTLEKITEATFPSACATALALYRNDNYEEAYAAFDTALHWLTNESKEKSDLLVAMAGIIYKFKGPDEAKTVLFQSIKIAQTPTVHSLFATCALGLLHSEKGLSKLALNELKRYERCPEYAYDIGFFKSYLYMQEDEHYKALQSLSKSIKMYPENSKLWYCLAQFCLQESDSRTESASACVQRAIALSKGDSDVAHMLSVASMAEQLCGNVKAARLLAQKAIHTHPQQSNNWAALILMMLPEAVERKKRVWLKNVISYVRRQLTVSRPMGHWLGLMERTAEKNYST